MLRIRITASSAILLLVSGLTAGGAAAQTATDQTPGSPLQLLQMLKRAIHPQEEAAASSVAKHAARRASRSSVAGVKQHPSPTLTASAAPTTDAWPAANTEPQVGFAVTEPAPLPASAATETNVSEIVVAGQTVKIAAPDDVNEIDLAANNPDSQAAAAAPNEGATSRPPMNSIAGPGSKSDSLTVASAHQPAPSPQQPTSAVGSAAWIAQVLAALGGAVAAGSAAWFLMGAAPQRTYG